MLRRRRSTIHATVAWISAVTASVSWMFGIMSQMRITSVGKRQCGMMS